MSDARKKEVPGDLTIATKVQALLELYKEQCTHGRHTESQRHLVTAMFLTASGALLTIVSYNKFETWVWPLAGSVCVLGLIGMGFAHVFEIKWEESGLRRNHYRKQVESLTGIDTYDPDEKPPKKKPSKHRFARHRYFWRLTFVFVISAGAVAVWLSLTHELPQAAGIEQRTRQ
jgi:hypothetical protein